MTQAEKLVEYRKRLESTKQEQARLVAMENQLLGAIYVLQELDKAAVPSTEPPADPPAN